MSFPTNVKQNSSTKVSRRPGGGWEDNAEEPQLRNAGNVYGDNRIKTQEIQAPVKEQPRQIAKPQDNTSLQYEACDEYFLRSHEYENKIVNDVIQPGGARVKQPDSTLHEFCNTCEHIQPNILGSILLSKFDEQIGWISKARVIFAIEALSKKFGKYFDFFKHNTQTLQKVGFTSEGPNANQLRNLMNGLMRVLSHPAFSAELQKENQTFQQKPSAPTLPHNNSQGDSKPKPVSAMLAPTKSASLPEPGQPNRIKYASHIALPTVKDSASPANANTNATPVNKQVPVQTPVQTENIPKPVVSNKSTPSKPAVENTVPVNNSQSPQLNIPAQQLNIPLSQGNSLMDSLSDVDFSSPNNNLYHLYKAHSPAGNFYGSPSSFGPGYMGGYSPAYYNYPNQVNPVQQGGFNAYVQQGQQNMNYQANSGTNMQYGGFSGNQNVEQGKKESEDDLFDQAPEIDYDREEKEKQKKREEIEKRFEALNF